MSWTEYMEAMLGMVRPLTTQCGVLHTIISLIEADPRFNEPTEDFVMESEDRIVNHIRMMRSTCGSNASGTQGALCMNIQGSSHPSSQDKGNQDQAESIDKLKKDLEDSMSKKMKDSMSKELGDMKKETMKQIAEIQAASSQYVKSEEQGVKGKGQGK